MSDPSSPVARRSSGKVLLVVLAGFCLSPSVARAQSELDSVWIRRDPVNEHLNGVAYGLNRFIAVGDHGYWFTSPNAQTWTVRAPLTDGNLKAIRFAGGRFVIVGDGIFSSLDGTTWEQATLPYSELELIDVAADGAGNWMAVGHTLLSGGTPGNGLTFTSADGVNWVLASVGTRPHTIAAGAGQWFATAIIDASLLQWVEIEGEPGSPPEYQWQTFLPDDFEAPQPTGRLIRFLNGRFVLCGYNFEDDPAGAHHVFTSTDGIDWSKGTVTNQGLPQNGFNQPRYSEMRDLAFGGGVHVGIAAGSPSQNGDTFFRADAMTSTDGVNWAFLADRSTLVTATGSEALTDITHANGQFVAVGYRHTTPLRNTVVTSPDGMAWTSRSFNPRVLQRSVSESAVAIASGGGLVMAVTEYGGAAFSTDHGVTWGYTGVTAGSLSLGAIAYGNGRFVAGGQQGWAYRTMDGLTWNSVQVPEVSNLLDMIHDGTQFIAVGQHSNLSNGIVARSIDGASWTTVQVPAAVRLKDVAFGNGVYVALAANPSSVHVSTDAVDWSTATGAPAFNWVAFGAGRFLGVAGESGQPEFHISTNGVDWTLIETADEFFFTPFFSVRSLTHVNGHFVLGGSEMGVMFLDENDRWVQRRGPVRANVTFSENTYVATSLWTYTLPEPEPPLDPPVFTWQRVGESIQLDLATLLDHRYRLWQRSGLDAGSSWYEINSIDAQGTFWQFVIDVDAFEINPQFYQISVEPPGTLP